MNNDASQARKRKHLYGDIAIILATPTTSRDSLAREPADRWAIARH